jgi:hypothetical protein
MKRYGDALRVCRRSKKLKKVRLLPSHNIVKIETVNLSWKFIQAHASR